MTDLDEMMGFLITTGQVDDTFGLVNQDEQEKEEDEEE